MKTLCHMKCMLNTVENIFEWIWDLDFVIIAKKISAVVIVVTSSI